MNFDVDLERRERFDEMTDFRSIDVDVSNEVDEEVNDAFLDDSENVTDLDIENFVVVLNEIVDEILSLSLLKLRLVALTIFSFVWCCDEKRSRWFRDFESFELCSLRDQ